MRIACLHIPQFALQTLTRIDPSLRGAAVAVVGVGGHASTSLTGRSVLSTPVVQACSRAAWALGVRLGMTATSANTIASARAGDGDPQVSLRVVTADPLLERETMRAIADALLGASASGATVVDLGGRVGVAAGVAPGTASPHLAMYCEVPSKTRGVSFGEHLLDLLDVLGLAGRIGIADDRFTAWVAAAHAGASGEDRGVVSVPRGGSAAFLAPRPLSLLAITAEVQHMLEALGVRTLGEFAALPAPSVARPLEADYQALARGDSGQMLRPYAPEAPIREELVVSSSGAAVAGLAQRLALRLAGRGRGAAKLEATVVAASGETVVAISPQMAAMAAMAGSDGVGQVLESAEELAEALGKALGKVLGDGGVERLRVVVTGEAIAGDPVPVELPAPALDTLAAVRSPTAHDAVTGLGWRLTPPGTSAALRTERRDAHRRTRHGKQRRGRPDVVVQARLFADRK